MTTAYTSLLGFSLPVTGELSGTWGDTVNDGITKLLDSAIAGTTTITTDADVTLSTTTGASNTSRQAIILWNPTGPTPPYNTTRTITAPAQSKIYTVINASSGTQSIILAGVGPTTGVTIAKGESALVAWNGSDFIKISNTAGPGTFTDLTVTGNTTLGNAVSDTITVNSQFVTGTVLRSAQALTNTLSLAAYDVDGTAYTNLITLTAANAPTLALTSTGVGTINNMSIGATTASTGAFTTLSATGNTTIGAGSGSPQLKLSGAASSTANSGAQLAFAAAGTPYAYISNVAWIKGGGSTDNNLAYWTDAGLGHYFYANNNATTAVVSMTSSLLTVTPGATIQTLTVGLGAGAVATNTAVGYQAAFSNVSGSNNSYLGYQSGYYQTGSRNTGLGFGALVGTAAVSNTGTDSTAIGSSALAQNYSGLYNTAVGSQALIANTTASFNTAVGFSALITNIVGAENSAFGVYALRLNNNGNYNSAFGLQALEANVSGNSNTAAGYQALVNNAGSNNTAVGYRAAYTVTGGNNTAIGNNAGSNGTTGTSAGDFNTSVGDTALNSISTGGYNTAVGGRSLYRVSSGNYNVAMGYQAGNTIATATAGTFIGTFAGLYATGADNTAVGYAALSVQTNPSSGANNTAIGSGSLQANNTGANNTAVGYGAGYTNSTGQNLVAIGYQAGYTSNANNSTYVGYFAGQETTGTLNTFLGVNGVGYKVTTGTKNVIIGGYDGLAAPISQTGSNYIVLSDGDGNLRVVSTTSEFFITTMGTGAGTNALKFNTTTGAVTYDTSSIRYKNNIRDSVYGLSHVMQMRSAQFEYKDTGRSDVGLIAEELDPIIPELVMKNKDGEPDSVSYDRMVSVLVKAIQELKAEVDSLKSQLNGA